MPMVPPELAPVVAVIGRNFLRMLEARGELTDECASLVASQVRVDTFELRTAFSWNRAGRKSPRLQRSARDSLKKIRALARTPFEAVELGDTAFARNLGWLSREFGLTDAERGVLLLAIVLGYSAALGRLNMTRMLSREDELVGYASAVACLPLGETRSALSLGGLLRRSGLVLFDESRRGALTLSADSRVTDALLAPAIDREMTLARFLSKEAPGSLELADFGALAPVLGSVVRLLEGWKRTREGGLNVLLYGPSGVGKTEAARLVARLAGTTLYLAGGDPEEEASPSQRTRVASLTLGGVMLGRADAALLFDEMEDLTRFSARSSDEAPISKLWLNRLLEGNAVPTLWTTNSLAFVDPAMLRRFTLAIRFPDLLTEGQRRKAWEKCAGSLLPAPRLDALAQGYEVSPAEIASAVRSSTIAGAGTVDESVLGHALEGSASLRGARHKAARASGAYRLEAVNASRDVVALADRLGSWRPGSDAGLSLCLYGRSGTGKSEYVHHLARRLGRPLLVRNVSDLASMFVGDTERRIAAAFDTAQREGAVLLFDEADTFLADRRGARHSWERSVTNEFLQQLEACRGFVAVTTNLYKDLDPAVLRRFMFKVEFLPLKPEQRAPLWDAHLAPCLHAPLDETERRVVEAALRDLDELVPADFGNVARRARVLGDSMDAAALLRELADEVASRSHDQSRRIGFGGGFVSHLVDPRRPDRFMSRNQE